MAMAATRKLATSAISLIKATAVVNLPHIRFSNLETPNFIGSIRSMSQICSRQNRSAGLGFNLVQNSIWPPLACTRSATSVSSSLSTHKVRLYHDAPNEEMNMSKKLPNIQDSKRRLLAKKHETRRQLYQSFCSDRRLMMEMRKQLRQKLSNRSELPKDSSFTRIRHRNIFTDRSRGMNRLFRTSRIVFREVALKALTGGKKAPL